MVYKKKGTHIFKCRVSTSTTDYAELSTGCTVEEDAAEVEMAVRRWEGKREKRHARPALVRALIDGRVTLPDAFDASLDGTLDELETKLSATPVTVLNLGSRVTEWREWKAKQKRGARSAPTYLWQLRQLYPEIDAGTFTLDLFTRAEIARRLDALPHQAPTKNRYKLAASSFAKFLVRREVLETNVVRDIEGFGENEERMVYYERPEAKRLIFGLSQPYSGVAAFAYGFCMEWGGLARMLARDVTLTDGEEHVYVRGTKTKRRLRTVRLLNENRWLLPVLRAALAGKAPNALVFAGLTKWDVLREQRRVAKALKIVAVGEEKFGQHSLHDWRHSHTVQLLRDGYSEAIGAAHLGHANTDQLRKRYGNFIVTAEDYTRRRIVADSTAISTTTARKPLKEAR